MANLDYKTVLRRLLFRIVNLCMTVFPVKRNRVFFLNFYGKSFSDNPKGISEALYDQYGNRFEYIWVVSTENVKKMMPYYVKTCRYNSFRMVYYMATSKVWISNFCLSKGTYKRKDQYYIQTWHGDRGFKKILMDVPEKHSFIYETEHVDLMIAGSDFGEKYYYRGGFKYKGDIAKIGCPRNDIFFRNTDKLRDRIREIYSIGKEEKVVMFAPTFRNKYRNKKRLLTIDLEEIRKVLENSTNKKWKVLTRSHVSNSKYGFSTENNDSIISVTDYPDMNELLQITDVLISDYSSSIGDFCLSGRLCVCYQDDIDDYQSTDRALLFDMDNSPFFHFNEPSDLYSFLRNIEKIDVKKNCEEIKRFYGIYEHGNASNEAAMIIYNKCFNS